MNDFIRIYSLPGKIIAEIWYLWPKKGQIWASGRRRDHGFVHFMYSTIFYFVALFTILAGITNRPSRTSNVLNQPAHSSLAEPAHSSEEESEYNQGSQASSEPTPTSTQIRESTAEQLEPSAVVETDVPPNTIYESNPIVQEIPSAEETSEEAVDDVKSRRKAG